MQIKKIFLLYTYFRQLMNTKKFVSKKFNDVTFLDTVWSGLSTRVPKKAVAMKKVKLCKLNP